MRRFITRFSHPLRGINYALHTDQSFRVQVFFFGLLVGGVAYMMEPLDATELVLLLLGYALILITELQNSALESALNRLHPEHDPAIGVSKDMAAGAVLIAGIFFLIVLAFIVLPRLG